MIRFHNWEVKLGEFLFTRRDQPFTYGYNDCCMFAFDAALAMTGVDIGEQFRGKYDSDLSASKLIIRFTNGGNLGDLIEKLAIQYGLPEVKPLFARRGDIVLIPSEPRKALGIVDMNGWNVVGPYPRIVELNEIERAWRI